ncbi:MAG TPA: prolyl oligopeptidase family serine peptidase [Caldilineaceae bacterium]|nr:prolyl oligopeptidase family serine peptidase [Caldilineaceae bacterium]
MTVPTQPYPTTRRQDLVETLHGQPVADPYRWLEDLNSPETQAWIAAQNEVTQAYLKQLPQRERIRQRLTELWNYERYGIPFKRGDRYFLTRNDGLQNQAVLYWLEHLDDEPKVLLDPNTLSDDGTVALSGYAVSDDGSLLAYALSASGSDWMEWRVREVASGADRGDLVQWAKFSGASWTHDNAGFFYSRYDAPAESEAYKGSNYFHKLYYHQLGTAQSEDRLIYERADQKEWNFQGEVTDDGRYLIIYVSRGTFRQNGIFYQDLTAPDSPVVELLNQFDAEYQFVGNDGPLFYFKTDHSAPLGRLIAVDIREPAVAQWQERIAESTDTLRSVRYLNRQFVANYLHDAHSRVQIFDQEGALIRSVDLPGVGTAGGFGGDQDSKETFYSFTSFTTPGVIYRYDLESGESTLFRQPTLQFDPALYETKQVFYTSKDGTQVPMFLCHKKGLELNAETPTYLYAYGGFNIPLTPGFAANILTWMEMGGLFAQPNLRGGGEYGKEWYQAGTLERKQNVFDDFIAAAEWLIGQGYTSTPKLVIAGGSNGGLLVGACMTQRPDLFGACLPAVGVLDMLRFHKFTIGWAWVSDYGSPDDPEQFQTLLDYSPYHNLKPGTHYPATLITTGDHDDRVFPAHSFKFAAALQHAQGGSAPTLIRIETKAGHGAGKPTAKLIEEATDKWAFVVDALEMAL